MLFSAPFFIIGIVSAIIVSILEKTQEVSENHVQQLLLNIDQKDFDKSDFDKIRTDNNFVVVRNFNHEINTVEALTLLEIAKENGIEVTLIQRARFFGLDQSPKKLFSYCMDLLWTASI